VTYDDTQQPFSATELRWERMREVVETDFMPLRAIRLEPPVMALTCEQKSTLLGWLEQCATPEGGSVCGGMSEELLVCEGE
jgi:hypothetical protein